MCFAPHQKSYAGNSNYTGKYDFRTLLLFLRFNLVKIHIYFRIPSPAEKLSSEELRKGSGKPSNPNILLVWFEDPPKCL